MVGEVSSVPDPSEVPPSLEQPAGASYIGSPPTSPQEDNVLLALDLGGVGSFNWNLVTGEGTASKGCYDIFGQSAHTPPTYSNVLRAVLPEDLDLFRGEIDRSLSEGRRFRSEFRIVRPKDGLVRWVRVDGGILADEQGRAARMVGIVRDVTERRHAQEREQLLTREVDHRAKNLLTVVQSLVQLTRAPNIDDFREAVSGRIQALGRAHSLLAASRWDGADLSALAEEELAPFTGLDRRVQIEGPPVKLRPAAAQSMALVLHELITNAAKYGALSNVQGTVELNWRLDRADDDRLWVRWCEHGGPPIRPPTTRGFGTTVISASVERQLGGVIRYNWRTEGLCCEVSLPGRELADANRSTAEPPSALHNAAAEQYGVGCRSILVVEDEPLISLQIAQLLREAGCEMVGPAASVGEAFQIMSTTPFDAALLDVDLNGARSFPIADLLREQGKPFGFLSGFGVSELPARFQSAVLLSKPLCPKELRLFVAGAAAQDKGPSPLDANAGQGRLI
jgi:PAS domain S-box-containing protein